MLSDAVKTVSVIQKAKQMSIESDVGQERWSNLGHSAALLVQALRRLLR